MKKHLHVFLSVLVVLSMLAACSPAPAAPNNAPTQAVAGEEPAAAPTQAVAGEEPAEPPAEEAPAEEGTVTLAEPVPYPDGTVMAGSREPKTFNLDEIFEYTSLDSYSEPEYITALVEAGDLPPVEERLPNEPQVIKTSFMADGGGEYGGVFRNVWAAPTEGWNYMAGRSVGWFGIESVIQESLVISGPVFLRKDAIEPLPNLAKSWEWSDDGMELTMHLIEGAKWSDGDAFDTEDVMFLWEDNILDENVNSWTQRSNWQIDGQDISLEAIDEYTIKWTFPVAFPSYKMWDMDELQFAIGPSHILKPLHPKYNDGATYASYRDALAPDALPHVTMGPWVPVEYRTDELMIMRRNPYYWKVDSDGKQLPYMEEVVYKFAPTGVTRTVDTLAGKADTTNVENPETFDETVKQANEPDAPFRLEWGPETLAFDVLLNLADGRGVEDERDAAVRELFRDVRFRRAISQGIDREGISRSLAAGPFFRPWPGGLYPGSQFYTKESVVYYPFSTETSRALLAEIGLEDTNGDGYVEWTEGPMAGQNVELSLTANEDQSAGITLGESMVNLMKDIGIKINYRTQIGSVTSDNDTNGTWDMQITRPGQQFGAPNTRCTDLAPLAKNTPNWHREGDQPRNLLPFEQEMIDIVTEFCAEPDTQKQIELMAQYNKLYTENVYTIGLVVGRYALGMNKDMKNVPIGAPAFMYQWSHDNFLFEQMWLPEGKKQAEALPETIAEYSE